MPEPPANFANICRMPNQRIPPPPNGLQSVRQQLNRRLAGQADLLQTARRAALKIRERFRRAPRNPQEGRTETRTTRDVRSTSAAPRPNPTSMDLTVRSQWRGPPPPPPRPSNEGPTSDTDLPPTATTSTWTPPCHLTWTTAAPAATTIVGITVLPTQANCQPEAPPVSTSEENRKHPPCPRGTHPRQPRRRRMRRAPTGEHVLRYVRPDGTPLAAGSTTANLAPTPPPPATRSQLQLLENTFSSFNFQEIVFDFSRNRPLFNFFKKPFLIFKKPFLIFRETAVSMTSPPQEAEIWPYLREEPRKVEDFSFKFHHPERTQFPVSRLNLEHCRRKEGAANRKARRRRKPRRSTPPHRKEEPSEGATLRDPPFPKKEGCVTKLRRKRSRWRKNSVLSPSRARKLARSRLPQPRPPNPPRNPCFFRPTIPGL
jgi:hypothetical protein